MRNVTLSTGETFPVHPLKTKHVRDHRKNTSEDAFDGVFKTLELAGFDAAVVNELPFPDVLELSKAVTNETFGVAEEEKN